jgi:HemY protein
VLTKAWSVHPHPDLATAFAEIAPDETPAARIKRFRALTKLLPDHPETKMLLAELNIAAEDFPAARKAISDLVEKDPTARSLTLMAAIERGEGSEETVVRGWLAKALTAPRGPQWICTNCQHIHANWGPVCDNCTSFDTLEWKSPPAGEVAMPQGTEMLPLIIGGNSTAPKADAEVDTPAKEPEPPADGVEVVTVRSGDIVKESAKD